MGGWRSLEQAIPIGSKPAAELVSDFLGRPVSVDAYKAKLAKDQ